MKADSAMSVSGLASGLEDWLKEQRSRDLGGLLKPIESQDSWKTAPVPQLPGPFVSLALILVRIAKNTVINQSKLVAALVAVHNHRPCLFGTLGPMHEASKCGIIIRVLLQKFRVLKEDSSQRRVTLAKAPQLST